MKGLELSEIYFQQVGLPMLREKFADYIDRMAVGLVGDGSECFGFDDGLSRDHDWGPGFCIWLTREDHQIIGSKLKSAVAELPRSFAGFGPREKSQWGDERIGVFEISQFYRKFTGFDHLPSGLNEWLLIPVYKWMHRAVKALPILGERTHGAVAVLISEPEFEEKIKRVEGMCAAVIKELESQRISDNESSFLPDHGPAIQNRIKDKALREQNVWVG